MDRIAEIPVGDPVFKKKTTNYDIRPYPDCPISLTLSVNDIHNDFKVHNVKDSLDKLAQACKFEKETIDKDIVLVRKTFNDLLGAISHARNMGMIEVNRS